MGRPIVKTWFGSPVTNGSGHISVSGVKFADGTTATNAYILKQVGANAYIVQDTALSHVPETVFMVNASSTGALTPGQCFINATPFGGSALPCAKIQQFRLTVYNSDGTLGNYSWSTRPAVALGQADLVAVAAPVASFTGTPLSGAHPLSVTFTNNSTGSITSYLWTFGDSNTSTAVAPVHSYASAGTYSVSLQVTGEGGTNTQTRTKYITVS